MKFYVGHTFPFRERWRWILEVKGQKIMWGDIHKDLKRAMAEAYSFLAFMELNLEIQIKR